jgi:hypothetical protein
MYPFGASIHRMAPQPKEDPIRSTLLAVLRLLNQADAHHEGDQSEQALELGELERRLSPFGPVGDGSVKVSLVIGLLLRNGLVQAQTTDGYSWQRQRDVNVRYGITAEGKKFLVDAVESTDRIPDAGRRSNGMAGL